MPWSTSARGLHEQLLATGVGAAEAVHEQGDPVVGYDVAELPPAERATAVVERDRRGRRHQLLRSAKPAGRSPGAVSTTLSSSSPTCSNRVMCANSGTT